MSKLLRNSVTIQPAQGKVGVLFPGLGAVSTTVIAGVEAIRNGSKKPIGSLTQMGRIRLGKRTENRNPLIKDFVPLAGLDDLVFGGWDIFPDNAYQSAKKAQVLEAHELENIRPALESVKPMSAVFDQNYVRNISGPNVKKDATKWDQATRLQEDIARFREENGCSRIVMVWCASTETYLTSSDVHKDLAAFEKGLKKNDPAISPSMIYAYAALKSKVPYANGAPNLALEIPALRELAVSNHVPVGGKDFKTGQTLMKTIIAPGLKARLLGLDGWFSMNILGNRDGEVLADPSAHKTKEESKLSVIDSIFQPELYPDLYGNYHHAVRINYYPPRGDNKESWDNIDIQGWLGYPMQIKLNFLCRDSILAAPVVLDLALFLDLAGRSGMYGVQEWLSFYFKSPMVAPELQPEHDVFAQLAKLENTLRYLKGEELITHLGLDYYNEEA